MKNENEINSIQGGSKPYLTPTCIIIELLVPDSIMDIYVGSPYGDPPGNMDKGWDNEEGEGGNAGAFHNNIWEDETEFDGALE